MGTRNLILGVFSCAVFTAPAQAPAQAQDLRGTVRDSINRQPIPGAVLVLLDSAGGTLGRSLTNDRGEYRVALFPRLARLRVLRLGFRPSVIAVPLGAESNARLDVLMTLLPTMLQPVAVRDDSRCSRRRDRPLALGLWEQARTGLLATVVARQVAPDSMKRLTFQRTMLGTSDRIFGQRVGINYSINNSNTYFAARSAAEFVRDGFASLHDGKYRFYGPDADALLDESFALGYCFHIMDPVRTRPRQIGLGFAVAARKPGVVEIEGALWIDTTARTLVDIEYRYGNLGREVEALRPGGRIQFRTMANSLVLIDRWVIRAIGGGADTAVANRSLERQLVLWYEAHETGGELAAARWADGTTFKGSLGTLRVHAVTSVGVPAAGPTMFLLETDYSAQLDTAGDLMIPDLVPGPYTIAVVDSLLAPVGVTLTTQKFVAMRDSVTQLRLKVPTAIEYVADRCLANKKDMQATAGTAWVLARLTMPDGTPIKDAEATISFKGVGSAEYRPGLTGAVTGSDGLFQNCKHALGSTVQIWIRRVNSPPQVTIRDLKEKLTVVPVVWRPEP